MRVLAILLFAIFLNARENPFVQVVNINKPSQQEELKEFKKLAFNVPSDARILNKIKLYYTNIDGVIKEYEMHVNEALDWHRVYMLIDAREISLAEPKAPKVEKVEDKLKIALNMQEDEPKINKQISKEIIQELSQDEPPSEFVFSPDFKIVLDKNKIIIKTHSKLLREFNLKKPNRIVLDFAQDSALKNKTIAVKKNYVDEIYSGVHKNFYRLVIKLDGIYHYELKPKNTALIIELK